MVQLRTVKIPRIDTSQLNPLTQSMQNFCKVTVEEPEKVSLWNPMGKRNPGQGNAPRKTEVLYRKTSRPKLRTIPIKMW